MLVESESSTRASLPPLHPRRRLIAFLQPTTAALHSQSPNHNQRAMSPTVSQSCLDRVPAMQQAFSAGGAALALSVGTRCESFSVSQARRSVASSSFVKTRQSGGHVAGVPTELQSELTDV